LARKGLGLARKKAYIMAARLGVSSFQGLVVENIESFDIMATALLV
jgi:hypothetical protein